MVSRAKALIWDDILAERSRQDAQWGGPDHDDDHGVQDWRNYREKFEQRIMATGYASSVQDWSASVRASLVKIAALTVAQIESLDRRYGSRFKQQPQGAGKARIEARETVDHPAHYGGADNPYEAIKVIEAWGLGFCLGNTVKYISRAGKKDPAKEIEDLEKASWYLTRRIQELKGEV